jgi:hypothetical protein
MKTTARYYFNSKTEMNDWLIATGDQHLEQGDIEDDPDFQLYIYNETTGIELFYDEHHGYFPEIDGADWSDSDKYQVVV